MAKGEKDGMIAVMRKANEDNFATIVDVLKNGGIVVLRTDTIYGIVTSADNRKNSDTIFAMKQRDADKSCIVLIADTSQMWDEVSREAYQAAEHVLGDTYPTSVIVPIGERTPEWLVHHDQHQDDVAFRIPSTASWLIKVLEQTGPLIAPSANLQGQPPAKNVEEAYRYFGDAVDLYVEGGTVESAEPSHLYRVVNGVAERLR